MVGFGKRGRSKYNHGISSSGSPDKPAGPSPEGRLGRQPPAEHRQIEMAERRRTGQQAATRRALDKTFLNQKWLDDLFDHVALVTQRGRHRLDPDRAAAIALRRTSQIAPIHGVGARSCRLRAGRVPRRRQRRPPLTSPSTAAKSRMRRNRRIATRGVPRARRAISAAPSRRRSKASTRAPRATISVNSAGS